jgi:hypothetical protein
MTLTIKHAYVSTMPDDGNAGEVGPNEWNESHIVTDSDPLVFLATGQSELEQRPSFAWTPNANCFWWNWDDVDGHLGTSFLPITTTATIRIAERFASEVARLNPARKVCIVNIAKGGQDISHWMPGASAPDVFANIVANVVPALASIGKTAIDGLLWYHGVSQTGEPYRYPENFETVMARFQAQSWFPRTTPVLVIGIAPTSISDDIATDVTNARLQAAVRADQGCRRFVDTGSLDASFWDATVHPNGAGCNAVGAMAAAHFVNGPASSALLDPVTGFLRAKVIGRPAFRNLIIGGDFSTNPWQRGTSLTGLATNNIFTADRWAYNVSGSAVVDIAKTADAPTIAQAGMFTQHCLDLAVATTDTSIAAGDQYAVTHKIEGLNTSFLGFGQAGARPITISFWVKATLTGTYYISVRNSGPDRSYVAPYTINVSNTWERKEVTIPGDASGTWLYSNALGIRVSWILAAGSNFVFTPNVWSAGNLIAGPDQVNVLGTVGNRFKLAIVQGEEGVGASSFEQLPVSAVLERCQRFYRKSFELAMAPAQNSGSTASATLAMSHVAGATFGTDVQFDNRMRGTPTITTYNPSAANSNWRDVTNGADRGPTVANQSEGGFTITGGGGAAGALNYIHWQAAAEL